MTTKEFNVMAQLRLEALHYLQTGRGAEFLRHAIDAADAALCADLATTAVEEAA